MKRLFIYTERQRKEILAYLKEMPNAMPPYVRQLRKAARRVNFEEAAQQLAEDYDQVVKDLVLMQRLADLEIPIGRKKKGFRDMYATARVRQTDSKDAKAEFEVRRE
jgi:hypothetical protein